MAQRLVEQRLPMPMNPSPQEVLSILAQVYARGRIEQVTVTKESVTVRRYAEEGDDLLAQDVLQPEDVFSRAEMEELTDEELPPYQQLFQMFFRVNTAGLEVSHVYVGDVRRLRRWLGLPEMVSLGGRLFGVRALREPTLPENVILVCGAPQRGEGPAGITYIIKSTMGEVDA